MSVYSFFYHNIVSHSPETLVERFGGPFTRMSSWFAGKPIEIPVVIDGLKFFNPIGMSSGWADSPSKIDDIHRLGAGIVTSKTITVEARDGNPRPRLVRGKNQLINSMGLPNKGLKWWVSNLSRSHDNPSIISIRGETINEWTELINELESFTDIFELNFSCPNLHEGVMDLSESKKIVNDIASITDKRIWLKLSPEYSVTDNINFINSVRENITGITAINTVPVRNEELGHPNKQGGLSGDPIHRDLVSLLKEVRSEYGTFTDLPVFAVGGINSSERAWNIFTEYKSIPLVLTAFLMQGPYFFRRTARYFQSKMNELNLTSLQSFIE